LSEKVDEEIGRKKKDIRMMKKICLVDRNIFTWEDFL